jgi:Concanavalin A-like lectin/glucanases superfamily
MMTTLKGLISRSTRRERQDSCRKLNRYVPIVMVIAVLAPGLQTPASASTTIVALYHMEEASGTVAHDASGNGNRASIHSLVYGQPGFVGHGFGFKGAPTLGYLKIPASSSINPGARNFSYTVHFKIASTTSITHDYSLIRRGSAKFAGAFYKLELVRRQDTGAVHAVCAFRDTLGNHFSVQGGSNWNTGTWTTLTCQRSGSTFSLTRDAKILASRTMGGIGNLSSTTPIFVGVEQINATRYWEHFQGTMDEITFTKG